MRLVRILPVIAATTRICSAMFDLSLRAPIWYGTQLASHPATLRLHRRKHWIYVLCGAGANEAGVYSVSLSELRPRL